MGKVVRVIDPLFLRVPYSGLCRRLTMDDYVGFGELRLAQTLDILKPWDMKSMLELNARLKGTLISN